MSSNGISTHPVLPTPVPTSNRFITPKLINDPIHGHIELNPILFRIIDTPQFQRLRDLHQLGTAHLVFPGASHTRFEHSLGVAHLAGAMMHQIAKYQPELVTDKDILLVQMAGLCHDLGHGPFSHIFDGEFLPQCRERYGHTAQNDKASTEHWCHENGSLMLLDQIYTENIHYIQSYITHAELALIKQLIVHSKDDTDTPPLSSKGFMYEIVSNARNGVDVDKFDYLLRDSFYTKIGFSNNFQADRLIKSVRVIGDEICYNIKDSINLYELFSTRYKLHKMCYSHRVCKAVEYMVVDIMLAAEPVFHFSAQIHDANKYLYLTDNIISRIEQTDDDRLRDAQKLIRRLKARQLYKMAIELTLPYSDTTVIKNITPAQVLEYDNSGMLTTDDLIVQNLKLNYALRDKDPIKHVHFYHKTDTTRKFAIRKEMVSIMIPNVFQETIVRVFLRYPTDVKVEAARAALRAILGQNDAVETDGSDTDSVGTTQSVSELLHGDDSKSNMSSSQTKRAAESRQPSTRKPKRQLIYRGGSTGVAMFDINNVPKHLKPSRDGDDELNTSSNIYPTPTKPKTKHRFTNGDAGSKSQPL